MDNSDIDLKTIIKTIRYEFINIISLPGLKTDIKTIRYEPINIVSVSYADILQ